ncbi:hypothetical protein PINS_up015218 [Pythium insidiosum]|nr:hypothetical protein PINS_up015218 [Pythium insidiosum]
MPRSLRHVMIFGRVVALLLLALSVGIDRWRSADGLSSEEVVPDVFFERLTVGTSTTCVTLRRFSRLSGAFRSHETCYRSFLGNKEHPTMAPDLVTGQQLVFNPVCRADAEWTAEKLGVPPRVRIAALWETQCYVQCIAAIGAVFTFLFGLVDLVTCCSKDEIEAVDEHWFLSVALPLAPVVAISMPILVWTFVLIDKDERLFEVAISLRLAYIVMGLLVWCWTVDAALHYAQRLPSAKRVDYRQLQQQESDEMRIPESV